jgi:hypothetical protein
VRRSLKNVAAGKRWPACGTRDGSSDCFVKIAPVVAAYAGTPEMLDRVADVVRITQNNRITVAYAQAAARVLERIILDGVSGAEAVRSTIDSLYEDRRTDGAAQIAEEMESTSQLAGNLRARVLATD